MLACRSARVTRRTQRRQRVGAAGVAASCGDGALSTLQSLSSLVSVPTPPVAQGPGTKSAIVSKCPLFLGAREGGAGAKNRAHGRNVGENLWPPQS